MANEKKGALACNGRQSFLAIKKNHNKNFFIAHYFYTYYFFTLFMFTCYNSY